MKITICLLKSKKNNHKNFQLTEECTGFFMSKIERHYDHFDNLIAVISEEKI